MILDREINVDEQVLLRRYRSMMVVIGILYPAWRFVAYYFNPTANESWEQRGLIGAMFLAIALLSYRVPYFKKNISTYFNIITYTWFCQVFYLMVINNMSYDYMLLGLVVIFTVGTSFLEPNSMLWYYLLCLALSGVAVSGMPDGPRFTFLCGLIVAIVVSYLGLLSLLNMFQDLQASRAALKQKTDEFVELSAAVQTLFLPLKSTAECDRWKLSGFYRPVDGCGGDWWSYFEHGDKLTILTGDVTGHGPGPAMMTASIASYTRALQNERPDISIDNILRALNKYLLELQNGGAGKHHYLMTVLALEIDFSTRTLTSWSAGAPGVMVFGETGEMRVVGNAGNPLGLDYDLKLGIDHAAIEGPSRIIIFTDGIMEVNVKGKRMSERKFLKILSSMASRNPMDATGAIIRTIDDLRAEDAQEDDYTLVVLDVAAGATAAA